MINNTIDETVITCRQNNLDCRKTWDYCKSVIKYKTIQFAKYSTTISTNEIKNLESKITKLEAENSNDKKLDHAKKRLEKLYMEKASGSQIRSRINCIENGEKNNKYFLNLEKQRQSQKTIKEVRIDDQNTSKDENIILKTISAFYKKLYTTSNPNINYIKNYIKETKVDVKLSDGQQESGDGKLKVE